MAVTYIVKAFFAYARALLRSDESIMASQGAQVTRTQIQSNKFSPTLRSKRHFSKAAARMVDASSKPPLKRSQTSQPKNAQILIANSGIAANHDYALVIPYVTRYPIWR
jgi:hypothetical protein